MSLTRRVVRMHSQFGTKLQMFSGTDSVGRVAVRRARVLGKQSIRYCLRLGGLGLRNCRHSRWSTVGGHWAKATIVGVSGVADTRQPTAGDTVGTCVRHAAVGTCPAAFLGKRPAAQRHSFCSEVCGSDGPVHRCLARFLPSRCRRWLPPEGRHRLDVLLVSEHCSEPVTDVWPLLRWIMLGE
jgi:hypothetical protein